MNNIIQGSALEVNFFNSVRGFFSNTFGFTILFIAFCLIAFPAALSAQALSPTDIAPPPLKILPKEEKEQLEGKTEIKDKTKLALELMEARLKKAESFDSQDQFMEMYTELGKFHALIDYTLKFLNRNDDGSRKVLNNFKRFEIGIRAFTPRLELMRRNLPIRYEEYVRNLIVAVRDTRSKAVEAFFADSVVREKP